MDFISEIEPHCVDNKLLLSEVPESFLIDNVSEMRVIMMFFL